MRASGFRLAFCLALVLAPPAFAQTPAWPQVVLVRKAGGLSSPTLVTNAGDGSGRLFVLEQGGRIRLVRGGALVETSFLDVSNKVSCCGERGLLGLAFSPGYSAKGTFYVNYTDRNGDTTVSRFRVSSNADLADGSSEEVLLKIVQPFSNHNGGQLAFGPDGFLYVGMGDGGSAGDPNNNAQNPASLLGKILRIDVESGASPYGIPPSNPFLGNGAYRPEIWAVGLRNPWRFSFDRKTGDLFIADVGQGAYEEINFQPAASRGGENYGWRLMEGLHCFNPASGCNPGSLTLPVVEYGHSSGNCSVTGGHVYRGRSYAGLFGLYFYGDYCSGKLWGLRPNGSGGFESRELLDTAFAFSSFGEDEAGELYVADYAGGVLYQVTDAAGITAVRLVPAILDVTGVGGARFTTELTLGNRGTMPATLVMTYTSANDPSAFVGGTVTETLPVGRQLVFADALQYLRAKGVSIPLGDQVGTLRIVFAGVSSGDAGYALVRATSASGSGRAGLAYPAVGPDEALFGPAYLFGLRENAADRSNVALVNAGDPAAGSFVSLRLTLFSGSAGDGRSVTLDPIVLGPGKWTQLNALLTRAGFSNGYVLVERISGTDPFFAYAVINDNATADGSYVAPVPASRNGAQQTLAVVVETPRFATEVVLTNPGIQSLAASVTYTESLSELGVRRPPVSLVLAPREQRVIPSFLQFLREGGASSGPAGGSYGGTVSILFGNGTAPVAAFAGARVAAYAPQGGAYGLFLSASTPAELARSEAWIYGLRQDATTRSNLAVSESRPPGSGGAPLSVKLEVFNGDTGTKAGDIGPFALASDQWMQFDSVLSRWGVRNGYARVTVTGGGPFQIYGVVNDGSIPGQGTSDGSFLPMAPSPPPAP